MGMLGGPVPHPVDRQTDTTTGPWPVPLLTSQNTHEGESSPLTRPHVRNADRGRLPTLTAARGGIRTQTQV